MWALQVSKNGRTVKSIYSHNIFSSFATKKWHFYRKYAHPPGRWGGGHIYGKNAYDKMGLGIFTGKKITVNMPPLKSSLIKPSKSMLFFHIWNANFSVTPINSQMYMTKPKQVQKKLSENTGKTFSVIMPSFTCRGWAYLRKLLYNVQCTCTSTSEINQTWFHHISLLFIRASAVGQGVKG